LLGCDFDNRVELRNFARGLSEFDTVRFEAMLHAWPEGFRLPASRLDYMERWERVEVDIERFIALGLTTTFTDVFDNFLDATAKLSGGSSVEVLTDHLDRLDVKRGMRVVS
jgi:hypothetical protein